MRVVWVVRVGGGDGEFRPWHYMHAYSIERTLIKRSGVFDVNVQTRARWHF